jgi:hypothetical protein
MSGDLNQAPAPLHPLLEGYGAAFMAMGTQPPRKFKTIAGGRRMLGERAFSNQGGVEYSQSHRAQQEEQAGRIPGYDNMSFAQRRAHQMQQQFGRGPQKSER